METNSTSSGNKSQIWIWVSVLGATILIIFVIIFVVFKNFSGNNTFGSSEKGSSADSITRQLESNLKSLTLSDFVKSYTGTRETIDGTIEPVLFEIKNIDAGNNSFAFILNIGMSKKINGFGTVDLHTNKISADVVGVLSIKVDESKRIKLKTIDTLSNIKFNLFEEIK
jgi:hypothetical protein